MLAIKPPSDIELVTENTGLLIHWQKPLCHHTGYIDTYHVQCCQHLTNGGLYYVIYVVFRDCTMWRVYCLFIKWLSSSRVIW